MQVSNDFALRMVGNLLPQLPRDKTQVYDSNFESVIRKLGAHQLFIDASRCTKLSTLPFGCFRLCKSLSYLDISYTKLNDLRVLTENCSNLRALNISGLALMDRTYNDVANLASIEVLAARNCNIQNVDWLEKLSCLRSLDLGMNTVKTDPIWHVRNMTRLEELVLDRTKFPVEIEEEGVPVYANIEVFEDLTSLKLINISETELSDHGDKIVERIGRQILLESAPRSWLIIAAIAVNDYRAMQRILSTGHDIDARVTLADEARMARLWRTRCITPKQRAPFFMCSAVEEQYRPNALHFAVFFNALECVQILLDNGADDSLPVWFSDVKEAEGKFVENAALSAKQTRKIVSAKQLVEAVFTRNVHRITADMIAKKVAGWKAVITTWYKRLLFVFKAPRGGHRLTPEEIDAKMASTWVETGPGEPDEAVVADDAAAPGGVAAGAKTSKPATPAAPVASRPGTSDLPVLAGMRRPRTGGSVGTPASETKASGEGENGGAGDGDDEHGEGVGANAGGSGGGEGEGEAEEEVEEQSPSKSAKEAGFKRDKIIPRMPQLLTWRDHGIVEKCIGKPVDLEIKVPILEIPAAPAESMKLIKKGGASTRASMRKPAPLQPAASAAAGAAKGMTSRESVRMTPSSAGESSMGFGPSSASMMASSNAWAEEAAQKYDIVKLPLLGKQSFWLESRALTIRDREREYERLLAPVAGGPRRLDAVGSLLLDAAKFRPGPQPAAAAGTTTSGAGAALTSTSTDAEDESESVVTSGDNTPGFISGPMTPFMMSPPGTAPSPQRHISSRETHSRGALSSRSGIHSRGGAGGLAAVDERGVPIPDPSVLRSTASVKRLSSSERRDRFLQELSQRMEDRFMPDEEV